MYTTRFLTMTHFDWLMIWMFVVLFVVLLWKNKLPSTKTVHDLADILYTPGGAIAVLGGMSMIFFKAGLQMFYWSIDKVVDGKIAADNALIAQGIQWVTGGAFGLVIGAMLVLITSKNRAELAEESKAPGDSK